MNWVRSKQHAMAIRYVLLIVAMLMLSSTVYAQPGRGRGGNQSSFQPDVRNQDLPVYIRILVLSEEQQIFLDGRFEQYALEFESTAQEVRDAMRNGRPGRENEDAETRKQRDELRGQMDQMREKIRKKLEDASTPEERRQVIDEIREEAMALREQMMELRGDPPTQDEIEDMQSDRERMLKEWEIRKQAMIERFNADVQATLAEEQQGSWDKLQRALRRGRLINQGRLSGESVDLIKIVENLELDDTSRATLADTLDGYEVQLDAALQARTDRSEKIREDMQEAQQARDVEKMQKLMSRGLEYNLAVRRVNDDYAMTIMSQLMDPSLGEFTDAYHRAAFPRIYRTDTVENMFDHAFKIPELDDETLAALVELLDAYTIERDALNEQLRDIMRNYEVDQMKQRMERMAARFSGGDSSGNRQDPIGDGFQRRSDLNDRYITMLRNLLGEEHFAQLPQPSARGNRDDRRGGDGRGFGMGRGGRGDGQLPPELVARFDTDGDGELNEEERDAMREEMRRNMRDRQDGQGGRGGRGGGGGGGRGGGGGGGGGRGGSGGDGGF